MGLSLSLIAQLQLANAHLTPHFVSDGSQSIPLAHSLYSTLHSDLISENAFDMCTLRLAVHMSDNLITAAAIAVHFTSQLDTV